MKSSTVLLRQCKQQFKDLRFVESGSFYWSPKVQTIHFNKSILDTPQGQWALLHEASHAMLNHQSYPNDIGLLSLEVDAWQTAEQLGNGFGIKIDSDHIQDCLNTYRDWIYARSTCPTCELNSLQIEDTVYLCLNCSTRWIVSQSRFCRPYRMQSRDKKTPSEVNQTVFA